MHAKQRLSAQQIAEQQLLSALRLWEAQEYVGCITLAGAADEILGKRLRKLGIQPSFDNFKEAIFQMARHHGETSPDLDRTIADLMNQTRNELKHYAGDDQLEFDLCADAEEMLERAIAN